MQLTSDTPFHDEGCELLDCMDEVVTVTTSPAHHYDPLLMLLTVQAGVPALVSLLDANLAQLDEDPLVMESRVVLAVIAQRLGIVIDDALMQVEA